MQKQERRQALKSCSSGSWNWQHKKHTLLRISQQSLGAICGLLLLSSTCLATPQGTPVSPNSLQPNVYLMLGGGVSKLNSKAYNNQQSDIDGLFKLGYNLDAAIGYAFNRFISSDISLNYINNANKSDLTTSLSDHTRFALYQTQLMLNTYLHLPLPGALQSIVPFIGGGIGYNWITFTKHTGFLTSNSSNTISQAEELAVQATGGINLQITTRAQLGAVYRFSVTDNNHLQSLFPAPQQVKALYNNSITLQLTLHSAPLGSDDL